MMVKRPGKSEDNSGRHSSNSVETQKSGNAK